MSAASPSDSIPLTGWQASGNATLVLAEAPAALRMDFDFKGGKGFVVGAPRLGTGHAARVCVAPARAGPRSDQRPADQARRPLGSQRMALRRQGAAAFVALEALDPREPRHRVCLGSGERQHVVAARFHRDRRRGGRGRPRVLVDRRSRHRGSDPRPAADADRLERASGLRGGSRACGDGLEARAPRPAPVDRPRFAAAAPHRRPHHRLARPCAGIGLSSSSIDRRHSMDAGPERRSRGRQAQLRLFAGSQDEVLAARAVRAVGRCDSRPSTLRVLALDRGLLVRHRRTRSARLASPLAAPGAGRVDADRSRQRNAMRAHER